MSLFSRSPSAPKKFVMELSKDEAQVVLTALAESLERQGTADQLAKAAKLRAALDRWLASPG